MSLRNTEKFTGLIPAVPLQETKLMCTVLFDHSEPKLGLGDEASDAFPQRGEIHCDRLDATLDQHPAFVEQWHHLLAESPAPSLELHPLMIDESAGDPAESRLRAAYRMDSWGNLEQLAILQDKAIRLPILAGRVRLPALRGARLVGRQSLGDESPEAIAALVSKLFAELSDRTARLDAILFEELDTDSALWRAIESQAPGQRVVIAAPQTHWKLRLAPTADAYWSTFSSKTRYNFRRLKRLFAHDWKVVTCAAEVGEFLEAAEQISQRSWQGKRLGSRVRRDAASVERFERLAEMGALRSYLLCHEGRPVAFAIGTQWNGVYSLEEIGYDSEFADSSPGTVLLLEMIDDLHAKNPPETLDFGFGDGAYKQMFGNEQGESGSVLVLSPRLRPRWLGRLHRWAAAAEQAARRAIERCGVRQWIRRRYRS